MTFDNYIKSLETPYNQTNEYKRLCYVINRDKERKLRWFIYMCGYGVDYSVEEMDKIHLELTGTYYYK